MNEQPPDGYRWIDGGPAMRLIDPENCPAGHPFAFGQRGHTPCVEHRGHPTWTCRCGQNTYRVTGAFVAALTCR